MLARQIRRLNSTIRDLPGNVQASDPKGLRFVSRYDRPDTEVEAKPAPTLRQWRPHYDTTHKLATKLKIFDRGGRPSTDLLVILNAPWDLSPKAVGRWWKRRERDLEIYDQRFIKERHEILGSNLAAAHFMVHRGGKVKFAGQSGWVEKDEEDNYTLPGSYVPDHLLEAIDANGINLYYEGLMNLCHLNDLKFLSLRGCKTIDDWCLDRISSLFSNLKYLDVSECINVSERGLEALYRMRTLKRLLVTNHHASAALELTCLMLEDCVPGLTCEIRSPEAKTEPEKIEA